MQDESATSSIRQFLVGINALKNANQGNGRELLGQVMVRHYFRLGFFCLFGLKLCIFVCLHLFETGSPYVALLGLELTELGPPLPPSAVYTRQITGRS